MNRGSADPSQLAKLRQIASMRPRFMNRGSNGRHTESGNTSLCFNEAPIHESGKYDARKAQKQTVKWLQ